jgi:hypothetical protein
MLDDAERRRRQAARRARDRRYPASDGGLMTVTVELDAPRAQLAGPRRPCSRCEGARTRRHGRTASRRRRGHQPGARRLGANLSGLTRSPGRKAVGAPPNPLCFGAAARTPFAGLGPPDATYHRRSRARRAGRPLERGESRRGPAAITARRPSLRRRIGCRTTPTAAASNPPLSADRFQAGCSPLVLRPALPRFDAGAFFADPPHHAPTGRLGFDSAGGRRGIAQIDQTQSRGL